MNATGMGIMMAAIHPNRVPAHCTPKLTIIWRENNGKTQPTADRRIVFAAMVDAALLSLARCHGGQEGVTYKVG